MSRHSLSDHGVLLSDTVPSAVLLPTPCWWIDRDDAWETPHYPTRQDAEADHANAVREEYGWPLSVAGALAIYGHARQESVRCWEWTCPRCGLVHSQGPVAVCGYDCGFQFTVEVPR